MNACSILKGGELKEAILHFEMDDRLKETEKVMLGETMDTMKDVSYALASETYEQIRNHGKDNCYGCLLKHIFLATK